MATGHLVFGHFVLDNENRQLKRDGETVQLNSRYFDALSLLAGAPGRLISKDRFLAEVWQGTPVTDEALTQCIKVLRKQLGDNASSPHFIETVPKHGYRFIASVTHSNDVPHAPPATPQRYTWQQFFLLGAAGVIGGGVAGLLGGLLYGLAASSHPLQNSPGTLSVLLVILSITLLIAVIGSLGVSFGVAAAGFASRNSWQWQIFGGAAGGMLVGAIVKLLGIDAFNLLLGQSPGDITGATEGALLGGAVGLGVWVASRASGSASIVPGVASAALIGAGAGMLIPLLGGRLMVGSLDLLASRFPGSYPGFDQIGRLFGESNFGQITQIVTGALEGMLFCSCIVAGMIVARRRFSGPT